MSSRDASRQVVTVAPDAIEHGRLSPRYWATCAALTVGLVIDVMKPLTLGFVMPGMAAEYGLPMSVVSVLALVALTGTALGSILWGLLADRFGRRPAFLLATALFIATAFCGTMPTFGGNLAMCFAMGLSAGGMLPLVLTLVAELTPRRLRGPVSVTVGGLGGLGGYLTASNAAHYLEPIFGWRSLWLVGLPTGLLLLALTPLIPESPLFLLRLGHRAKAARILTRYGCRVSDRSAAVPQEHRSGVRALLRRYPVPTAVIGLVGISWGLVNFGFLVMLPVQLRQTGVPAAVATSLLARSALFTAPALLALVALYTVWRGRRSLALSVTTVALALSGIAVWSLWGTGETMLLVSVGTLVLGLSAVNAMLLPYSSEIYPTALRATGTGLAAAATKCGGILGPSMAMLVLRSSPGPGGSALGTSAAALAGLSIVAALLMHRYGAEPVHPYSAQQAIGTGSR